MRQAHIFYKDQLAGILTFHNCPPIVHEIIETTNCRLIFLQNF